MIRRQSFQDAPYHLLRCVPPDIVMKHRPAAQSSRVTVRKSRFSLTAKRRPPR